MAAERSGRAPAELLKKSALSVGPVSPRVCVIGAGCCGLTSIKALKEAGLDPVCFEMGSHVGGLWVLGNSNGRGGAYRSLHINSSKKRSEFSDFPMPDSWGHYPHHEQIAEYFNDYAQHFDLGSSIRFRHEVELCRPRSEGGYEVIVVNHASGSKETQLFDAVVVANGHHFAPQPLPHHLAENFGGTAFHSHHYLSPSEPHDLRDRSVVVVGIGNSAMDIACELSRLGGARSVTLSTRRGAWVLPKFLQGKPIDQGSFLPQFLPDRLKRQIGTWLFRQLHGSMKSYGLPEPDHLIGEAHPTMSTELPSLVASGDIQVRPSIASCQGKRVVFADGRQQQADAIIFCTGYRIEFPFFSPEHIAAPENELPLFLRAFHPQHHSVFFVGLLQTVGAVMPSAEAQARLIAAHIAGNYHLPASADMRARMQSQHRAMKNRFVSSARHTMQVVPEDFLSELKREEKAGRWRAKKGRGVAFRKEPPRAPGEPS